MAGGGPEELAGGLEDGLLPPSDVQRSPHALRQRQPVGMAAAVPEVWRQPGPDRARPPLPALLPDRRVGGRPHHLSFHLRRRRCAPLPGAAEHLDGGDPVGTPFHDL